MVHEGKATPLFLLLLLGQRRNVVVPCALLALLKLFKQRVRDWRNRRLTLNVSRVELRASGLEYSFRVSQRILEASFDLFSDVSFNFFDP